MVALHNQITQKDAEIQTANGKITALQAQTDALTAENADLLGRIQAATATINEATQNLQQLSDPANYNEAELARAFAEIDDSIREVSNALDDANPADQPARPPMSKNLMDLLAPPARPNPFEEPGNAAPAPGNQAQAQAPPQAQTQPQTRTQARAAKAVNNDTVITLTNFNDKSQFNMTVGEIVDALRKKAGTSPKHAEALKDVYAARTTDAVVAALAGLTIKNNRITGGKRSKTKKNKKQKGGFKYSNKAKRASFGISRSTASNRKSGRSSRNTTSKR